MAVTSTLHLKMVLDLLLERIDEIFPFSTASNVRLFKKESEGTEILACHNIDEEQWRARLRERRGNLSSIVAQTKTPLVIQNLQTDPRIWGREFFVTHGLASYLGVPLVAKGEFLGVLSLFTKKEHPFSNDEVEFFSTLAGQAAIAIYNSQLYEATKEQAQELKAANESLSRQEEIQKLLKELSQDITVLDIDSLLQKLTKKAREIINVDISDVRLVESEGSWAAGRSGSDSERPPGPRRGLGHTRVRWFIENRRPLLISDLTKSTDLSDAGETIREIGVHGYVGVPLFSRSGELIGTLRALTYQPRQFSQGEVDLLQQLANGAAIALENAKLYEEVKKQTTELEKSNSVKSEFLGVMSHELRTPLHVVMGYTDLIRGEMLGGINPKQKEALEKIAIQSIDLLNTINRILQATQLQTEPIAVERHEVDLRNLLKELRSVYSDPVNKEIALLWDYPDNLPVIKTDGNKLENILQNLINNSLKFTERGAVTISARLVPVPGAIEFRVADTGIGMSNEIIGRLFGLFQQGDASDTRPYGGTGLGLYIVKKLTAQLDGTVDVKSARGAGTTFTVVIPLESKEN